MIAFVRRYFNLSFRDAVVYLAQRTGIDLTSPPSAELSRCVAEREEVERINQAVRAAEQAELRLIGQELADARRLYLAASTRLTQIEAGAAIRFPDEGEVCWEAMKLAAEEKCDGEVAYAVVAFGTADAREAWLAFPEKREAMIAAALARGFVKNEKGVRHQVPA